MNTCSGPYADNDEFMSTYFLFSTYIPKTTKSPGQKFRNQEVCDIIHIPKVDNAKWINPRPKVDDEKWITAGPKLTKHHYFFSRERHEVQNFRHSLQNIRHHYEVLFHYSGH